jgi:hypothetical protein
LDADKEDPVNLKLKLNDILEYGIKEKEFEKLF